jgi:hypothetical protein
MTLKQLLRAVSYSFGAILALLAVGLFAPRAARAVVATLVQVTNTTANPVPVQDIGRPGSQILELNCPKGNVSCFAVDPANQAATAAPFTVPAGQVFVMTSADLKLASTAFTEVDFVIDGFFRERWGLSGQNEVQLQFSVGIPVIVGQEMHFESTTTSAAVTVHGYLTSR